MSVAHPTLHQSVINKFVDAVRVDRREAGEGNRTDECRQFSFGARCERRVVQGPESSSEFDVHGLTLSSGQSLSAVALDDVGIVCAHKLSAQRSPSGPLKSVHNANQAERRQRSMVGLTYDVHVEIINWVYRNLQLNLLYRNFPHIDVDYRTLSACSLVCRGWRTAAQRLLFRNLNPVHGTYGHFASIRLGETDGEALEGLADGRSVTDKYLAIMAFCPNIKSLYITLIDLSSVIGLIERLRALDLRLERLQLASLNDVETPETIASLVRLWPSLQSLDVGVRFATGFELRYPVVPFKTPRSISVSWAFPELTRWLLEGSDTSALRKIEVLRVNWDNPDCARVFSRTSALENLTSLIVDGALPPKEIMDRCVRLETLVFAVRPTGAVVLPRTLHHLGYHAVRKDKGTPLHYLLDAIQALPVLRLVTATRTMSTTDLTDLTHRCEEIRVDLGLYSDHSMFRAAVLTRNIFQRIRSADWI
ncbi:hypothetical protein FA95DRAFT_1572740 [Auriscalpium vulgare]|uniref:Uncharacterized protein n=1 Tax=Auriscalpium vulgare TaxID=40419 RepID=A0ACB8RSF1_9AGAM|nr:hypothetical protein FA95DRAFT_1572740 [Auriscalpium vulgare]